MSSVVKPAHDLSPEEKRARLAQLVLKKARTPKSYPLSFAQQRLWFLYQLDSGDPVYHMSIAVRLTGALNREVLARCMREIVRRHDILRTTFMVDDDHPLQVVAPPSHALARIASLVQLVDLRALPASDQAALAQQLSNEHVWRGFDLSRGPLIRSLVLQLEETEHLLIIAIYHIIADGWSVGVLVHELVTLYAAFSTGQPSPLPPLPIQYADFAVWQREWLQDELLATQLAYWRTQLANLPVLELPTDRPRPPVQAFKGREQHIELSSALTAAIQSLSQREGVTMFMVLLASFQTLLARYSGQADIVVGSPIANRRRTEIEPLIGVFINMLALRSNLAGNPSFQDLLCCVRTVTLDAYTHQDLPFERLVEELQPERDLSRMPLFQVGCVLQNAPMPPVELPGLTIAPAEITTQTSRFDLNLSMREVEGRLQCEMEYNTDLFDPATIRRMLRHFQILLATITAHPDRRLMDLALLDTAERHQLLVEWNATERQDEAVCLDTLFADQANYTPDSVALSIDARQITYHELNQRANQLAQHLRGLGVGPEVLVGVALERSLELPLALLAVLKAGAAYLPLDPSYPAARLAFIQHDAQAQVLVVATNHLETRRQGDKEMQALLVSLSPPLRVSQEVVDLQRDWPAIARQPTRCPEHARDPDTLAYLIYTSGSTGTPKGAMTSHRAIVNRLRWMQDTYRLTAADVVLHKTPISFDVSLWELTWPLLNGARLVLARPHGQHDPAYLVELIARSRITTLHFVPSMLELFLELPDLRGAAGLRRVLCSGEALSPALVARFYARLTADLHNLYGPTEAAIDVSAWRCTRAEAHIAVPIGRPVSNTQLYVLDPHMQPVPLGVVGELYLGGVQLARGYRRRPDRTAERFVPNPWVSGIGYRVLGAEPSDTRYPTPDTRLYKTGDLARVRSDGAIVFLGRRDGQVKLRGVRIELGEIEAVLARHPSVRQAVVLARADSPGEQCLVAYVVTTKDERRKTKDEPDPSIVHRPSSFVSELRAFLAEQLPSAMLPAVFVCLDALPLTPNGKLDRDRLPAPAASRRPEQSYTAPRSPTEHALARLFAELLLHHTPIGVHDDFFALGGHSLLATQLLARLRDTFAVELSLRALFASPTVAGLAALLAQPAADAADALPPLPPLLPSPPSADLPPLAFAQQRLWFLHQLDPRSTAYTLAATLGLRGPLHLPSLAQALHALIQRHAALRTTVVLRAGQPRQLIAPALHLPLRLLDLRGWPAAARPVLAQHLGARLLRQPFDLATGPLVRLTLLRLASDDHALLLTLHHSIADGWSLTRLSDELLTLYAALRNGSPAALPDLPITYADYAIWQHHIRDGPWHAAQLAYWTAQLHDAPALALPYDHPPADPPSDHGAMLSVALPDPLVAALDAHCRRAGVTRFMALLAVWASLLARWCTQHDLLLGTTSANRARSELEALVGCCVNLLLLRVRLASADSFATLLGQVRATCLAAYAHQELPFEQLIAALLPRRSAGDSPLLQALLVMQPIAPPRPPPPELEHYPFDLPTQTAQFPLSLLVAEPPQGLLAQLNYASDRFEAPTIARLAQHFAQLLTSALAQPTTPLSALDLLSRAARQQLLVEWNPAVPPTGAPDLATLLAAQAARRPDAVALAQDAQHLSYAALHARVRGLATRLHAHGVGPEVVVAILAERTPAQVIALLAVLACGGAYLPLDPSSPPARLALLLADARPVLLLTQRALLALLPADRPLVLLLDGPGALPESDAAPLVPAPHEQQLLALLYTSGSTGAPKGVLLSAGGLSRLCLWYAAQARLSPHSCVLQLLAFSFDAAFKNLLSPLLCGGQALLPPARYQTAAQLLALIDARGVTVLNSTPSLFAPLLELAAQAQYCALACLRDLSLGGEPLRLARMAEWLEHPACQCRLTHMYGPTECSDLVSSNGPLRAAALDAGAVPPIGRALEQARVYVLDQHGQLQPLGWIGELAVSGGGLARGYAGRPDLTAARFVPNPFVDFGFWILDFGLGLIQNPKSKIQNGTRLYKTGDLARWRADGRLELLGRTDGQVKLRGVRIELGALTALLAQHEQVAAAAVRLRADAAGTAQLVAYVVPAETLNAERRTIHGPEWSSSAFSVQRSALAAELRTFMAARLPAAQVPAAYVLLDALPLTAHGKLDERALPPPPAPVAGEVAAAGLAPRAGRERAIAAVWCRVFGLAQVGRQANFFDLGGHSLLLLELQHELAAQLGVQVSLLELFAHPSIAALAAHLAQRDAATATADDARETQRVAGKARRQQRLRQRQGTAASEADND